MRVLGLIFLVSCLMVGCGEAPERSDAGGVGSGEGSRTTATSAAARTAEGTASEPARRSGLRIVTIRASSGEEVRVRVEIADDDAERARGLMYRTALAEDRGMLFDFEEEQASSFWMKNTFIPLSIAFMNSEGRIVDIQEMKPLDDDPPSYESAEPAQYALEVNRGFFKERGVEVGDRAELPG